MCIFYINIHTYIYIYIYYILFIYIYIYISISKIRHLFLNELYFGLVFEGLEETEKPKYN